MEQAIPNDLYAGPDAPPAASRESAGQPQGSAGDPGGLSSAQYRPPWPIDTHPPSATVFIFVLVAAVIATIAALIAGASGSPTFSYGLAIGVGVGAVPYLLFCIAHAGSSYFLGGRSQRRRKLTKEEWQRMFGAAPAGGASGSASSGPKQDASRAVADDVAAKKELLRAYKILGLSADASMKDITGVYRRLAHRYHPDIAASEGEKARMRAEQRMTELNVAYDLLRKNRHRDQHQSESEARASGAAVNEDDRTG